MSSIQAIGAVGGGQRLTAVELAEIAELAKRDREVRVHEAQHLAAAGSMASGIKYTYETGPDGKLYAVGGSVQIRITAGATPEETLAIARQIRSAADAPADPSGQDRMVAAQAGQMEAQALQQIASRAGAQKPKG
ncbi:MAG: putative metalloprotease CJM1_0395 family protein [Verrucomicrobiota bacterium]|jgi:hypothetical protein